MVTRWEKRDKKRSARKKLKPKKEFFMDESSFDKNRKRKKKKRNRDADYYEYINEEDNL